MRSAPCLAEGANAVPMAPISPAGAGRMRGGVAAPCVPPGRLCRGGLPCMRSPAHPPLGTAPSLDTRMRDR